jgi:hypothetical protein
VQEGTAAAEDTATDAAPDAAPDAANAETAESAQSAAAGGEAAPAVAGEEITGTTDAGTTDAGTTDAGATDAGAAVASGVESNVATTDTTQPVTSTGGTTTEDTVTEGTTSEGATSEEPPAQTEPGAADVTSEPATETSPPSTASEDQRTLDEMTYGFQVNYPADFLISTMPGEQLSQLTPTPLAGWRVMNPQTAASDIVELEPADLEIRVYAADSAGLQPWLIANALLPADTAVTPAPFEAANVSGLEVCSSTMLAPGCGYFFASGDHFYQLIPASVEGEAMMRSFRAVQ